MYRWAAKSKPFGTSTPGPIAAPPRRRQPPRLGATRTVVDVPLGRQEQALWYIDAPLDHGTTAPRRRGAPQN
jgi:hypothetical protein